MRVRVYKLATALGKQNKVLLDLCRKAGINAKNALTSFVLDPVHLEKLATSLNMSPEAFKEVCRTIDEPILPPSPTPEQPQIK
jgi:hypothetical protein